MTQVYFSIPNVRGSHSTSSGISVMAISEPSRGISQGRIAMVVRSIVSFEMRDSTLAKAARPKLYDDPTMEGKVARPRPSIDAGCGRQVVETAAAVATAGFEATGFDLLPERRRPVWRSGCGGKCRMLRRRSRSKVSPVIGETDADFHRSSPHAGLMQRASIDKACRSVLRPSQATARQGNLRFSPRP
jgi:hypothetical protein